nr:hypothetical protein [Propionibacterium sp.]
MFRFTALRVPLVAAPMAGGPSTPALVAAAGEAGGLGFLAAGSKRAGAVAAEIAEVRDLTRAPFGVNLFVPPQTPAPTEAVDAYRAALGPLAAALGVSLAPRVEADDDWDAKLDLVAAARVPVVSFTFGLPPMAAVARLRAAGSCVLASVASVPDAARAVALGVDGVVLQGVEAGGHRATLTPAEEPNDLSALDMLPGARDLGVPVVAAGGFGTGEQIAAALAAGAAAVQLGTALLLTPEAGTSAAHRAGLVSPALTETVVTRAFTGRPARALANAFVTEHPDAPAAYPEVNLLTSALRQAAARSGDLQHTHFWAGTGWRLARAEPAAAVLARLWADAVAAGAPQR